MRRQASPVSIGSSASAAGKSPFNNAQSKSSETSVYVHCTRGFHTAPLTLDARDTAQGSLAQFSICDRYAPLRCGLCRLVLVTVPPRKQPLDSGGLVDPFCPNPAEPKLLPFQPNPHLHIIALCPPCLPYAEPLPSPRSSSFPIALPPSVEKHKTRLCMAESGMLQTSPLKQAADNKPGKCHGPASISPISFSISTASSTSRASRTVNRRRAATCPVSSISPCHNLGDNAIRA